MKPEQFDQLATTKYGAVLPDGTPVISLMSDPSGAYGPADGTDLFVSVVPKGANGLRWAAIKADVEPGGPAVVSPLARAWRSLSTFIKTDGPTAEAVKAAHEAAAKGDTPVTFEAALYPRKLMNTLWDGQCALETAIRGILEDEATADKYAAITKALDAYKTFVLAAAAPVVAAKSADLPILAAEAIAIGDRPADPLAAKIGRSISSANAATIRASADKVSTALAALQKLLADTGHDDHPAEKSDQEDPMKLATLVALATLAIKEADPKADDATVAQRAGVLAAKMAADPAVNADVGEPANDLARLLAESGLTTGAGGSPMLPDAILSAILKLPAMKAIADRLDAVEKAINGTPAAKSADGADVAAEPGLRDLTERAVDLAVKAARALGVPQAPNASDPDADRAAREKAAKAADPDGDVDTFKGSAFSF